MVSDLLTHVERSLMVDVDLNLKPQCESSRHETAPYWHGGDATHLMRIPCGHGGLRCYSLVASVMSAGGGDCRVCEAHYSLEAIRFIEL